MRAFKQMPNQKRMHNNRGMVLISLIAPAVVLSYLQREGTLTSSPIYICLIILLFAGAFFASFIMGRVQRCPDCGKFMREVYDDPKAKKVHILHCRHCDTVWDTGLPKSND